MKTKELIKLLKATKQCYIVRHGANHDIWYSEITGKKFVVPRHGSKELPAGTVDSNKNPQESEE